MSKLSLSVAKVAAPASGASLALPDPSTVTVAALTEHCAEVVRWSKAVESVSRLEEAREWLDAVETYLSHKNAEGPAQTAARLLEARIGDVLGPAEKT